MTETTHKGWKIEKDPESGLMFVYRPDGSKYGQTQTASGARKMRSRAIQKANEEAESQEIVDAMDVVDAADEAVQESADAMQDRLRANAEFVALLRDVVGETSSEEPAVDTATMEPPEQTPEFDVIRPQDRSEIEEAGRRYQEQLADLHQRDRREMSEPSAEETEENTLEREELELLWECEDEIRRGMAAYLRVAEALHTIQKQRLYREDYATFGEYCRDKWNLTDRHARNMANAWEIALDLDADPIANAESLPANERQARELKQVPRERRAEVWEAAVGHAGSVRQVCAHDVRWARTELIDRPAAQAAAEAAAMADVDPVAEELIAEEERVTAERQTEIQIVDRDPINHAHRLINKYGAEYAVNLADEIVRLVAEKVAEA